MKPIATVAAALAAACFLAPAGVAHADGKKASVEVKNTSDWDIHHMYMAPANEDDWGPDQLGKSVIKAKGGSFTLTDIPCNSWDVKVVDEDGDECVIEAVDVCKDNYEWKITSSELLKCQGWKD